MMARQKSIKPLVHDDGTNKLKTVAYTCPDKDCGLKVRGLYNYAMHRAMKHNDWSVMQEWCEKKGKKIWWEI